MAMLATTSMVVSTLFLSVAVLIVTQAAGGGGEANVKPKAEDLVVGVCKNLTNDLLSDKAYFDEKPCISLLHSDKRSTMAKDHGDLVVIALDLLEHLTKETVAKIDTMLRELKVHNSTRHAFQFCSANYASMVRNLPACRENFLNLKPLGKIAPCSSREEGDALEALSCMDTIGEPAYGCYNGLPWDTGDFEEFNDVRKFVSLAWGLMEFATDCRDIYSGNW